MPQIDPKFTFWFGVWTNVLLLVASLGVDQAPHVVAQYAPTVQWFCMALYKINNAVLTGLVGLSSTQAGPLIKVPPSSVVKVLIIAFVISLFLPSGSAMAQNLFTGNVKKDFARIDRQTKAAVEQTKAAVTDQNDTTALPCDFTMLTKLTPFNLMPTMKACAQDVNNQLVSDTQRALDSAKAYGGAPTSTSTTSAGTGATTGGGDGDAVNCLTPALAIFKAAKIIPGVPEQPAVLNADGSVKTPEVPAVPEKDPGPILLYQKYREFTLAGGLTACQTWFNGPINATAAAGLGAVAGVAGAASVLAPK